MANNKPDPTDLSELLAARKQRKTPKVDRSSAGEKKKVGRPKGRRSNPDCSPLNLLIDTDTIDDAKYKLAKLNKGKSPKTSLSDLVEELLQDWLEHH